MGPQPGVYSPIGFSLFSFCCVVDIQFLFLPSLPTYLPTFFLFTGEKPRQRRREVETEVELEDPSAPVVFDHVTGNLTDPSSFFQLIFWWSKQNQLFVLSIYLSVCLSMYPSIYRTLSLVRVPCSVSPLSVVDNWTDTVYISSFPKLSIELREIAG